MRISVQPAQLDAAAARLAADAACLDALLVVARLEAAAVAVAGTQLAATVRVTAERLHAALFQARLQIAACSGALNAAAEHYELTDRQAMRGQGPA